MGNSKEIEPTSVEWKPHPRRQFDPEEEMLGHTSGEGDPSNQEPPVNPTFHTLKGNLAPVFGPGTDVADARFRRNLDFTEICWILCEMLDHANEDCDEIERQFESQLRLIRKAFKATRRLEVDRFCFGLRSGHREIDRALESLAKVREDVEKFQDCLTQNGSSATHLFQSNDLFRMYEVLRRPYTIERKRTNDVREEGPDGEGQPEEDWETIRKLRGPEAAEIVSAILSASGLPETLQFDSGAILDRIDFILNG